MEEINARSWLGSGHQKVGILPSKVEDCLASSMPLILARRQVAIIEWQNANFPARIWRRSCLAFIFSTPTPEVMVACATLDGYSKVTHAPDTDKCRRVLHFTHKFGVGWPR